MKVSNKIRNKFLATAVLLIATVSFVGAQTYDYTVNWSDTSTYKTSCGKVVPGQWSVKNDSCVMTTPYLRVEATEGCKVSFTFRINQSGNGDPSDKCYVFHQIDSGVWVIDTLIIAGGSPAVYSFSDFVILNYGHYIKFKICMSTDSKTEFWAIKGGDMVVTDGNTAVQNLTSWTGKPPTPPDGQQVMPVEFIWVGAAINTNAVVVFWKTASETNNDYFTIEKSMDAINFEMVSTTGGAGNSNILLNYSAKDNEPFSGVSYYRLKQTDFDGKFTYSNLVKVDFENTQGVTIYPNPFSTNATIMIKDASQMNNYELKIYNVLGTEVTNTLITNQSTMLVNSNLPAGIYSYSVFKKDEIIQSGKLISQQ